MTHTKTAQALKRRIFQLLGIEEYHESWADGLQVGGKCSHVSAEKRPIAVELCLVGWRSFFGYLEKNEGPENGGIARCSHCAELVEICRSC